MSKDHPCGNNLAQNPLTPGVLTICTEKTDEISNGMVQPGENFP